MPLIVRLAMIFAAGAIAGDYLTQFTTQVILIALGSAPLLLIARQREQIVLFCVAACGIALGALHPANASAGCSRFDDDAPVSVIGTLETQLNEQQRTVTLRLARDQATAMPCGKFVRVRMPDDAPALRVGDVVRATGSWMTLRINAQKSGANDGLLIATTARPDAAHSTALLSHMRGRVQERIQALFPDAYPLAEALLVAQRENLNVEVRESFAASGLTHLLAISGTHVALVAASLLLIARLLRCSRGAATFASIAGSAAYVFFLGAPYAAVRALIQMLLLFASRALQRPAHALGLLAAAGFIITAIDPSAPLDAGFQLSFAGICGIILWRRPLIDLLPSSIPTSVRDAVATTIAATAVTTPIAAFHFGVVSVIALVANLLAIPVVAVAVPAAAAAVAVSSLSMELGQFLAAGAELTLLWLNRIAYECARVPGGHFSVTPLSIAVSTIAIACALWAMRNRKDATIRGRTMTALLAGALPVTLTPLLPVSDGIQVHMIDVGQGDAFAIRSPRGRWLLVDAGPISEKFDAGKRNVVPFLLQHQASRIEAILLSHPHLDHFGGMPAVMKEFGVGAVIDPMLAVASAPFDTLLGLARHTRVPWLAARPNSRIEMDGMRIEFLAPANAPVDASVDANDYSATFKLSYGSFSALFLGDLPAERERELVQEFGAQLDVDLLKVAHHGSNGSSSAELLIATSPQVALISAGRRNRYRHPGARTMAHLNAAGIRTFRSDQDGTVSVFVDPHGRMQVRTAQ